MDQVTQTKVAFRREQWRKIIAECQASTLPVSIWCKQNGFKEQSYYYYLKKLRELEIQKHPLQLPKPEVKNVAFEKLEVQTSVPKANTAVLIHLRSTTLEIHNGATQQTIEAVLMALKNIC